VHFWRRFQLLIFTMAIAGCSPLTGVVIDRSLSAQGQDSRAQFLILHFTAEPLDSSIRILTQQAVSSHYLVTDESPPRVLQLVSEERRAWHAGRSSWGQAGALNASSIGIEIVNLGGTRQADGSKVYAPFPPEQMDAVLALCQDIVRRHAIRPDHVLGHSDIAPQRKDDPGPLFPWQRFAQAGLIRWPEAQKVAAAQPAFEATLPAVAWFQAELSRFGYAVPSHGQLDEPTRKVLAAFQMRYRPSRYDGSPDAETAAMLQVLNTAAAK
jgi:N-acetylmuramoyl-L-alanine amidase